MLQQIFLLSLIPLLLAIFFYQRYSELTKDAAELPAEMTPPEWWRHTIVEILLNVACFVAICIKIDVNTLINATEQVTTSGNEAQVVSVIGAVTTAAGIYKLVQTTILPLINKVTGGTTARKKLRNKVAEALSTERIK